MTHPVTRAATRGTEPASFDLLGPLPVSGTTTVLEASAGTGKTYTLAGLVTRYVAEGEATLDEMLLITFGRAASQELRERVRDQLLRAAEAIAHALVHGGPPDGADDLLAHLCRPDGAGLGERHGRLRDALAGFDSATIATTHQFCQVVLRSLGVAGDSDAGLELVESLDELLGEVVDDLYLQRFGDAAERPPLSRAEALALAREVVGNPRAVLTPLAPEPGSVAAVRRDLADDVVAELERRKRRLGVLGFDDLLGRLAESLVDEHGPARQRMRQRWRIVMVDEFQDTDPTQWEVIERAFVGHATVVLIGDPKQAIYAFRGGDVATYLRAVEAADVELTLDTNWRSDAALVERLQATMLGAALGHADIVVRPVRTHHAGTRLVGAGERGDPFRLRVVGRDDFGTTERRTIPMDRLRPWIATDLAADVAALLASGATYEGRPLEARDVAVIVEAHKDARACRDALAAAGVPAVYTGDTDVFASAAAADWLCLLEAFEQPHRSGLVRAAATTMFLGHTEADLAADRASGTDRLTDDVAATLRRWADLARRRGVAAVLEAATLAGMGRRVLSTKGGERHVTDLEHLGQLLHETAHRDQLGLPALLEWLRRQTEERAGAPERNRRLDSDAAAVQIMTVWVSKGLQYPVVYLPFAFNRNVRDRDVVLYHDDEQRRCLDVGGKRQPGFSHVARAGRAEAAGDDIRLTYVALTRAQSQVVAWWAPSWDEINGGLSRLVRGRRLGQVEVPDQLDKPPPDAEARGWFERWASAGGPSVETAGHAAPVPATPGGRAGDLGVQTFARRLDVDWRRTSYSGLIRDADPAPGVTSERELEGKDDEDVDGPPDDEAVAATIAGNGVEVEPATGLGPLATMPAGAAFGSLVHAVLEAADPDAPDLVAELRSHAAEQAPWWGVDVTADALAEGLLPVLATPLGPLAPGVTLGGVPLRDRLCELDFEIPLAGGDRRRGPDAALPPTLADVGRLLATHLPEPDPLRPYADRLTGEALGPKPLRGYLSGSIDLVVRILGDDGRPRFLVADYKTNRLHAPDAVPTPADYDPDRLTEAMLHSDYPLQALLYTVVVHRYLRWRLPGYDPGQHLGGVLYLYLRGMSGADAAVVDGHPAGVFSWRPPTALVTAVSDLLDGVGAVLA